MAIHRHSDKGSVLMEYLILNMLIGTPLIVFMHLGFYNLNDGFTKIGSGEDRYDKSVFVFSSEPLRVTTPGIQIKHYYQRILTGIGLPIP